MLKDKLKFFENVIFVDFVRKSATLTAFIYIIFFALESVLPGIIMDAFNFNFLLFAIVAMVAFIISIEEKGGKKNEESSNRYKHQVVIMLLLALFIITMFIVLYKVSLLEAIIYLIACLSLMIPLKNIFE